MAHQGDKRGASALDTSNRPAVSIAVLGGTITMATPSGRGGVVPALSAESLVSRVPGLADVATLSATTLSKLPGASLTHQAVIDAVEWARGEIAQGAVGVVIAQGTDTLEETAYLAGLYWDEDAPLVFTGAMRSPDQPSADGPANLIAACRVAGTADCRGSGVLVVLDNEIHEAAVVRKEHSTALGAFTSPAAGPVGALVEDRVRVYRRPSRRPRLSHPAWNPYVPLLETHLEDNGRTLSAVRDAGADGVVIAAFGVGHVSTAMAAEIERTASAIPVVVSSRTGAGGTLRGTYGFVGSESDLLARGAVLAGPLDERKSRALLWALLAGRTPPKDVGEQFARFGQLGQHCRRADA